MALTLRVDPGQGQALRWPWARRTQRQITPQAVGPTGLLTDRQARAPRRRVRASRSQAQVAELCRLSTRRRPGWWWPASHGTDRTRSVQVLFCFVALLVIRIVRLRLPARPLAIGVALRTERLRGMQEALGISANGAAPRVIPARSPEQEERLRAVH